MRFGNLPQAASLLAGIKPAVLAVIAIAIWRLGKTAVKDVGLAAQGGLSLAAFFVGLNPIAILLAGGLLGMLGRRVVNLRATAACLSLPALRLSASPRGIAAVFLSSSAIEIAAVRPSVARIAVFFFKVGAVLLGGGYVLLAFLEQGLVRQHGWLTPAATARRGGDRSIHARAGPFNGNVHRVHSRRNSRSGRSNRGNLSTVVLLRRTAGAGPVSLAAVGMDGGLPRFREWVWGGSDGGSNGPVGALPSRGAGAIALAAPALLLRWKISPAWIVLGGGIAGLSLAAIRW